MLPNGAQVRGLKPFKQVVGEYLVPTHFRPPRAWPCDITKVVIIFKKIYFPWYNGTIGKKDGAS
jgi:hypothetical protein